MWKKCRYLFQLKKWNNLHKRYVKYIKRYYDVYIYMQFIYLMTIFLVQYFYIFTIYNMWYIRTSVHLKVIQLERRAYCSRNKDKSSSSAGGCSQTWTGSHWHNLIGRRFCSSDHKWEYIRLLNPALQHRAVCIWLGGEILPSLKSILLNWLKKKCSKWNGINKLVLYIYNKKESDKESIQFSRI